MLKKLLDKDAVISGSISYVEKDISGDCGADAADSR
jgi:hypothetical protein